MWSFIILSVVVALLAAWLTQFHYKRTSHFSWMPAIILTVVSGINALVNFFITDGWTAMSFFFMFIAVSGGSFIGCAVMWWKYRQAKKAA